MHMDTFLSPIEEPQGLMMKLSHERALYRCGANGTDAERTALDYVTELTKEKKVDPSTFSRVSHHYSEREICEIVWLVASEHLYNMTNIGLNIHCSRAKGCTRARRERASGSRARNGP
jgi:alkylhydroperoxidase family enzyme